MGQTLSEPVTTKETAKCQNHLVKVGSSCMQGWRINMEDAHIHLLSLPGDKDACFFGVFDGHGASFKGTMPKQGVGWCGHKKYPWTHHQCLSCTGCEKTDGCPFCSLQLDKAWDRCINRGF